MVLCQEPKASIETKAKQAEHVSDEAGQGKSRQNRGGPEEESGMTGVEQGSSSQEVLYNAWQKQGRAGQGRAGQGRAGQGRAEQGRAGQEQPTCAPGHRGLA